MPPRSEPSSPAEHGIAPWHDRPGCQRLACPRCERGERDTALRLYLAPNGFAAWRCFRCGWAGHTARAVADADELAQARVKARRAAERERDAKRHQAREVFLRAGPIRSGDLADRYLNGRGLPGPWPPTLRLGSHRSAQGRTWRALVAAAATWPSRSVAAVQVTPLAEPGRKAWTKASRLTLGVFRGAAVRLAPWARGQRVVLTEGVEDGLAVLAACPGVAVWAVLGAWNAGQVALPEQVDVTLCLDGDDAGRAATRAAAQALWARGHRCRVAELPAGLDPNALLARAGA